MKNDFKRKMISVHNEFDWFEFPFNLKNMSCASHDKYLYFFGGWDVEQRSTVSTVVRLDPETREYVIIAPNKVVPADRMCHSACILEEKMLIFGGKKVSKGLTLELGDFWSYDISLIFDYPFFFGMPNFISVNNNWEALKLRNTPESRRGHSAVVYDKKMYIFGGLKEGRGFLNEMFEFDPKENIWKKVIPKNPASSPKTAYHSAVVSLRSQAMYVYGGKIGPSKFTNRLYAFSFITLTWSEVQTANKPTPSYMQNSFFFDDTLHVIGGRTKTIPSTCYLYKVQLSQLRKKLSQEVYDDDRQEVITVVQELQKEDDVDMEELASILDEDDNFDLDEEEERKTEMNFINHLIKKEMAENGPQLLKFELSEDCTSMIFDKSSENIEEILFESLAEKNSPRKKPINTDLEIEDESNNRAPKISHKASKNLFQLFKGGDNPLASSLPTFTPSREGFKSTGSENNLSILKKSRSSLEEEEVSSESMLSARKTEPLRRSKSGSAHTKSKNSTSPEKQSLLNMRNKSPKANHKRKTIDLKPIKRSGESKNKSNEKVKKSEQISPDDVDSVNYGDEEEIEEVPRVETAKNKAAYVTIKWKKKKENLIASELQNIWVQFLEKISTSEKTDMASLRKSDFLKNSLELGRGVSLQESEKEKWKNFTEKRQKEKISFLERYISTHKPTEKTLVNFLSFLKDAISKQMQEKEDERIKQLLYQSEVSKKNWEWAKLLVEMAKTEMWADQILSCGGIGVLQDLATLLNTDMQTSWKYTVYKSIDPQQIHMEEKALGRGGFGTVFRATMTTTSAKGSVRKTTVAVKKVPSSLDPQLLRRELVLLSMLKSPYVLHFLGAYYKEDHYYIVTDCATLGSLDNVYDKFKGELLLCVKVEMLLDVFRGVEYLHKHNIAHRDLKSSNVLVTNLFDALLCDFGIAKCYSDKRKTVIGGSSPYYAPELMTEVSFNDHLGWRSANSIDASPQHDMYSLGYVSWEMYNECMAYSNFSETKVRNMKFEDVLKRNDAPLPLDIQNPWVHVIKGCWTFEPSLRWTAAQCVKQLTSLKSQLELVFREDGKSRRVRQALPSKSEIMEILRDLIREKSEKIFPDEVKERKERPGRQRPVISAKKPAKRSKSKAKPKLKKAKKPPAKKPVPPEAAKKRSLTSPLHLVPVTEAHPSSWTVEEVVEYFSDKLAQDVLHILSQNKISGRVLLILGKNCHQSLEQMGITAFGDKVIISHAIEELLRV